MKGYYKAAVRVLCGAAFCTLACADPLPPPPDHPQIDENGVDVQSQLLQYAHQDLSIGPADHHGLSYTLYYSSQSWRDSFSNVLTDVEPGQGSGPETDSVAVGNHSETFSGAIPTQGDGSRLDGQSYYLKDGTVASFGHFVYGSTDPTTLTQTNAYYADYLQYPDGVRLTFHYRDDTGGGYQNTRLQSVTTNTGFQIKYYYQANTMTSDVASRAPWTTVTQVVAINNAVEYCDPNADSCALSNPWPQAQYSLSGNYLYETDATGGQTRLTNTPTSFAIKTPDSANDNRVYTIGLVYDPWIGGQTAKVTQASLDGRVTNYVFSYSGTSHTTTVATSAPLSDNRTYTANMGVPGVISFTNAVNSTTKFAYDPNFNRPTTITSPEGNWTQFVYDNDPTGVNTVTNPRGNITLTTANPKPGSNLAPLSESWVFPACTTLDSSLITCNQPTSYTDPRNATTSYTYDPTHGGKLTETLPADANGIQPVNRYQYAQQYAWVKNSSGNYVTAPTPIWVLTAERTCLTSATVNGACAAGVSDEVTTSYYYGPNSGPNNLLLRGKLVAYNGQSRQTCYGYDMYGNRISETAPRAGLTSCP